MYLAQKAPVFQYGKREPFNLAYGIPAVLGVPNATQILCDGDLCILDALDGAVHLQPDTALLEEYAKRQEAYLADASELQKYYRQPAALKSGERIDIGLNIGSSEYTDAFGAVDFIGLLRTEFLYMQSDHMPTEEEQYRAYAQVVQNAGGKPVTLRTLDIGGDKTLPYFDLPKEGNPFLGKRALRLCLSNPEIFNTQLRAALRASAKGPVWLMFPMVGSIDDIRSAKAAVERAKLELRAEGLPFDENLKIGIMIEIPSIAEIADLAAAEVDFTSVGSNDLTQYMNAVDRMNADISDYYQSFCPAMFRMLGRIFRAFHDVGKPVSVCGELAGNEMAALVLAGLGLKKMSMSASNISRVKRILSRYTMDELHALAQQAQTLPTQAEIKALLKSSVTAHLRDDAAGK